MPKADPVIYPEHLGVENRARRAPETASFGADRIQWREGSLELTVLIVRKQLGGENGSELTSGADFWCVLHCFSNRSDLDGFWGQLGAPGLKFKILPPPPPPQAESGMLTESLLWVMLAMLAINFKPACCVPGVASYGHVAMRPRVKSTG